MTYLCAFIFEGGWDRLGRQIPLELLICLERVKEQIDPSKGDRHSDNRGARLSFWLELLWGLQYGTYFFSKSSLRIPVALSPTLLPAPLPLSGSTEQVKLWSQPANSCLGIEISVWLLHYWLFTLGFQLLALSWSWWVHPRYSAVSITLEFLKSLSNILLWFLCGSCFYSIFIINYYPS